MDAVGAVLKGHEPNPAIAVDRHWNMVAANAALAPLLEGVEDEALLRPPVNVLRLSLHPRGLAPRIDNLAAWRAHVLHRLHRLNDAVADTTLGELEDELEAYPAPPGGRRREASVSDAIAMPLRIRSGGTVLSFITTITVFGTPLDVSLAELAIESFFPGDEETAAYLRRMQDAATTDT